MAYAEISAGRLAIVIAQASRMTRHRIFCRMSIACLVAFVVAALTMPAAADSGEWDALVKAARAEGKVELVLSGQVPQRLRPAMVEFEKKYGVRVNSQIGGGSAHISRLLAERRLNRYSLDVWLGGATGAISSLLPVGAAIPFAELLVDPEVKDPARWFQGKHHYIDPEGRYIFVWGASPSYNVAYNTNLVDPNEIRSYADLLNPKWKGKIVSWSPGQGAGASILPMFFNPKIGEQWFRRWATEMNVTIVTDARQGAEWVALGRFAIGMFGLNTQAEALKDQGFPIKDYLPHPMAEGEVLSASAANIMAMDQAPNPNAAKLFINWALSQEGQASFVKASGTMDSLRTDVPNDSLEPQYRIDPNGDYIVAFSNPEFVARQDEVLAKMKAIMREAGYQ
jgi:ABC-type Fe3+ transport system substrate-binding protein